MMSGDMLGEALNIARHGRFKEGGSLQRFD
jgi:hypothetical protein